MRRSVLVVDDTLNHKTGKHMDGVSIHYNHSEGRYVLDHQLVTSDLVAGNLSLQIAFELYRKDEGQADFKTEQELFRILMKKAADKGGFHSYASSRTAGTSIGKT